ncbi:hypothetical protein ES705_13555 [subsurface metagenome]|nr:MAG: hypothetical protein CEE42_02680 [Candidatus Lokiarchaeota archaeon Loki_b31]
MVEKIKPESLDESEDSQEAVIKETVKIQFKIYILIFAVIYYSSWIIPGIILMAYFFMIFRKYFLETSNFVMLFTELYPLLSLILMPLLIIVCYLIHLLFIGLATKLCWSITEKMSPSKNGIIPRNIQSKTANYYHMRSFMIKYGKNVFTKGMIPWLSNWFFNFTRSSKIGKGSTIEESVGSDKFIDVGKNCYIGVNSTLASHLVQGIFGNISYFEIKLKDNVTLAAMNQIGPGTEIGKDSFLLPLASCTKHSVLKGGKYYVGIPLRKIFKKKIMDYLGLTPEDLERNDSLNDFITKNKKDKTKEKIKEELEEDFTIKQEKEEPVDIESLTKEDLALDFTTSSAISRVNVKFLAVYIPIFWLSGLLVAIYWYECTRYFGLIMILFLPVAIFSMLYIFIFGVLFFSKLLLILVNLIHKPREGIFIAEIGDKDYEFWMLRTELKKISLWLIRNSPFSWVDVIAFKWFGINMDLSSHLNDAWCDAEFVNFGRNNLIGQGATIMSSMVVGKYLIIKKVIFDDYVMIGGHTTIAPGTIMGHDSVMGAISTTTYNQILEPNWIYFGIPGIKLKENKYAEERRDIIIKRDVDEQVKVEMTHEVNIDEDKKKLIKTENNEG